MGRSDKRAHSRVDVCAPVEVRLVEAQSGAAVSSWMYGVIRDVSLGGLKISMVGEGADVLASAVVGEHKVEVKFVPVDLDDQRHMSCELRWTKKLDHRLFVGVQFTSDRAKELAGLVHKFKRFSEHRGKRRPSGATIVAAIAIVLAVGFGMAATSGRGENETQSAALEERIAAHLQTIDELQTKLTKLQEQLAEKEAAAASAALQNDERVRKAAEAFKAMLQAGMQQAEQEAAPAEEAAPEESPAVPKPEPDEG